NFHMHLPHYALTSEDAKAVKVLATQPIDMSRPHPFTEQGHKEFNTFLWLPPSGKRAGDILFADSTIFSTLFGDDASLQRFWRNTARPRGGGGRGRPVGRGWQAAGRWGRGLCGPSRRRRRSPATTRRGSPGSAARARPPWAGRSRTSTGSSRTSR